MASRDIEDSPEGNTPDGLFRHMYYSGPFHRLLDRVRLLFWPAERSFLASADCILTLLHPAAAHLDQLLTRISKVAYAASEGAGGHICIVGAQRTT